MSTIQASESELTPCYTGERAPDDILRTLSASTVTHLPLKFVSVEEGFNARDFSSNENKDHVARLTKLIAANGVESPVFVRIDGNHVVLVDGESRYRAAVAAAEGGSKKAKTLPVLLDPDGGDVVKRTESLVVKNSGRTLAMMETLDVVKRLRALGRTNGDIQSAFGFSRHHMANLGLLDMATPAVREHIRSGKVAPTVVVDLIREHKDEPEVVEAAISKAVERIEKAEARASESVSRNGSTKVTARSLNEGVVYTRSNFHALIRTLQKLYAEMVPASDYRKFRGWVKNSLENVGASTVADEETDEE